MAQEDDKAEIVPHFKPVRRIDEYWDFRSYSWKHRPSVKPDAGKKRKAIIVVRRRITPKGVHFETVIDIQSSFIHEVMLSINEGVLKTQLHRSPPAAATQLFYHSLEPLQRRLTEEQQKEPKSQDNIDHLTTVLDFIKEDHRDTIDSMESLSIAKQISWNLLWALFKPNTMVYHYHELTDQYQILLARYTEERKIDGVWYVIVTCDAVVDSGSAFGYASREFRIAEYDGASNVRDLTVYPLTFAHDHEELLRKARARGKRFSTMTKPTYQNISGLAMRELPTDNRDETPKEVSFYSHGKLMVDHRAFRLFEKYADYNYPVHQSLDRSALNEDQLALCSPIVLGYCFGAKKWGGFALDRCEDIAWRHDAFDSLVLAGPRKKLLRALFKQHARRKDGFDDIVAGKGKGLIMLLSGNPGCGKTLTAESMSEEMQRPLYSVSAGELGVTPQTVDEQLTMLLALATTWNAIVLMDEAEVFMQKRDMTSIERNALVSVFLRQLEYYEGILVLTTNRRATIDKAFASRITLHLDYPDLDTDAKMKIWRDQWARVKTLHAATKALDDVVVRRLAQYDLNGREIKNTIGKALCIALDDEEPLRVDHIDLVLGQDFAVQTNKAGVDGMLSNGIHLDDAHASPNELLLNALRKILAEASS